MAGDRLTLQDDERAVQRVVDLDIVDLPAVRAHGDVRRRAEPQQHGLARVEGAEIHTHGRQVRIRTARSGEGQTTFDRVAATGCDRARVAGRREGSDISPVCAAIRADLDDAAIEVRALELVRVREAERECSRRRHLDGRRHQVLVGNRAGIGREEVVRRSRQRVAAPDPIGCGWGATADRPIRVGCLNGFQRRGYRLGVSVHAEGCRARPRHQQARIVVADLHVHDLQADSTREVDGQRGGYRGVRCRAREHHVIARRERHVRVGARQRRRGGRERRRADVVQGDRDRAGLEVVEVGVVVAGHHVIRDASRHECQVAAADVAFDGTCVGGRGAVRRDGARSDATARKRGAEQVEVRRVTGVGGRQHGVAPFGERRRVRRHLVGRHQVVAHPVAGLVERKPARITQ